MRKTIKYNTRPKTEKYGNGQSTLEFALVFPFLIMLVLICLQLGYVVYLNNMLEQSARECCRVISTTNSNAAGQRIIYDICPSKLEGRLHIDIIPADPGKRKVGDMLEVNVYLEDIFLFNLMKKTTGLRPSLRSISIMRMECN